MSDRREKKELDLFTFLEVIAEWENISSSSLELWWKHSKCGAEVYARRKKRVNTNSSYASIISNFTEKSGGFRWGETEDRETIFLLDLIRSPPPNSVSLDLPLYSIHGTLNLVRWTLWSKLESNRRHILSASCNFGVRKIAATLLQQSCFLCSLLYAVGARCCQSMSSARI